MSSDSDGVQHHGLLAAEGLTAVLAVIGPVVVAALPMLIRGPFHRTAVAAAAIVVSVFALVGLATVGIFYLPAAVLLIVAAIRHR